MFTVIIVSLSMINHDEQTHQSPVQLPRPCPQQCRKCANNDNNPAPQKRPPRLSASAPAAPLPGPGIRSSLTLSSARPPPPPSRSRSPRSRSLLRSRSRLRSRLSRSRLRSRSLLRSRLLNLSCSISSFKSPIPLLLGSGPKL